MKSGRIEVLIRPAEQADIGAIAALFADDALGGHGDTADASARPRYDAAFKRIAEQLVQYLEIKPVATSPSRNLLALSTGGVR